MTLSGALIGICPLLFAGGDIPELTSLLGADRLLDEIARLGFKGCQFSTRALPTGAALRPALAAKGLRIAEVYAALPCDASGPTADARDHALAKVEDLRRVDGDVLVYSYHLAEGRIENAGRANNEGIPRLTEEGWQRAASLADEIGEHVSALGRRLAYHPHIGTFIETPEEVERLMRMSDPGRVQLCLDVGHYTAGGGDPVAAIKRFGQRVCHVHMKDVDGRVLAELRSGTIRGFFDALRARIFTELGAGVLDVSGILVELARLDYAGWIMCEQDSSWRPASESVGISLAVLQYAMKEAARAAYAQEAVAT